MTVLPILFAAASGLVVETDSPDALCPPLESTRATVEARLGQVAFEGTWRARYSQLHRDDGDYLLLELRDAGGEVRLSRELPRAGESCATLSQVIALVLERYFRRFEDPESNAEPDPDLATTSPPRAPERDRGSAASERPQAASDAAVPRHSFELGGHAGTWYSAIAARYVYSFSGSALFAAAELAMAPVADEERVWEGRGELRRGGIELWAGGRLRLTPAFELRFGPTLSGVVEHVATFELESTSSAMRWVPSAGLRLGFTADLTRSAGVFLDAGGSYTVAALAPAFRVSQREIFTLPAFVADAQAGLRLAF